MSHRMRLGLGVAVAAVSAVAVTAASAAGIVYQKNTGFAGYEFTSSKVTEIRARFTIPTVTCTGSLSGVGPGAFIVTKKGGLTGTGLIVACKNNVATYQIATIVNSAENNADQVSAGNLISVQAHATAKGSSVAITDLTSGVKESQSDKKKAQTSYVAIGTAAILFGKVQAGVDKFTPVIFTDVLAQARSLAWWKPYAVERYRGNLAHPVIQIRPGPLTHAGQSFTLSFLRS